MINCCEILQTQRSYFASFFSKHNHHTVSTVFSFSSPFCPTLSEQLTKRTHFYRNSGTLINPFFSSCISTAMRVKKQTKVRQFSKRFEFGAIYWIPKLQNFRWQSSVHVCTPFSRIPQAQLMQLDSFFSGALCVLSGGRLPEALFMVFLLDSKVANVCKSCTSRQDSRAFK